jgi:hypothetical protein
LDSGLLTIGFELLTATEDYFRIPSPSLASVLETCGCDLVFIAIPTFDLTG